MITEAIWEEKKYQKGSSRPAIRNFIIDHYDVDEDSLKSNMSSTLTKMLEESDGGYQLLIRVDENYKLSPEWRKEWTKKYGKKQTKRKRRKKASDEPKHPRNGYLLYSKEVRKRRQDDHPDKNFAEITRMIADEWKNLGKKNPKKRKKFEEMAEADRERYRKEMKAYKAKKKRERRDRSSGSGSESSSPKKSSSRRRLKSESSDDSKRSPNKRRRRQSESESGSKEKKKTRSDSELKRKANSDDEGSRGKDTKKDKKRE